MTQATATGATGRSTPAVAAGWPVARRLGLGSVRPGGLAMTRRLHEGVRLGEGDRVVDLWAGSGAGGAAAAHVNLRSWTGIAPDAASAGLVTRRVRGYDRRGVVGSPDATGLPDGQATVTLAEGLLTGLSDPRKLAVLEEARRITRPGGRVGLHELCVVPAAFGEPDAAQVREEIGRAVSGGLRVLSEPAWREVVRAAGLRVTGVALGAVVIPDLLTLFRVEGPRPAGQILRRLTQPTRTSRRARAALDNLQRWDGRLAAIVVVAERPVVAGRARRGAAAG
jgi:SAM-dependent methyltransferase